MNTVPQSHLVPQVNEALMNVLTTHATALARSTGFIQRQRQLSGADFARLLVLGLLHDPQASLEALVQFGQSLNIEISAQGLDQRFSVQAATFVRALFEVAISQIVVADPVAIPLLARFGAVVLEDSTSSLLPDELAGLFAGSGGHNQGEGTMAAFKLHLRLDMLRGHLRSSELLDGRSPDAKTPLREGPQVERTLNIRDRGYFDLARLAEEEAQGSYSLTYLKGGVHLLDAEGKPLDLLLLLAKQSGPLELTVLVGEQQRRPMRLLIAPVPAEVVSQRRATLRRQAQTHGRGASHEQDLLARWTLVLTSVPQELLSLNEALVLLRLRWQIELLFKLWKQEGLVDQWRTQNAWRVLCEVYAKLIGLLIQHWLLIVSCWQEPHRSLVKASKAVRSHAIMLAYALAGELSLPFVVSKIQQATRAGSRLNTRKTHPNTSQLLFDGLTWTGKTAKETNMNQTKKLIFA